MMMAKETKKSAKKKIVIAWVVLFVALAASLLAEKFIQLKPVIGIQGRMFFHAWFGLVTCIIFVLFSKILGFFIKRHEGYYKENSND